MRKRGTLPGKKLKNSGCLVEQQWHCVNRLQQTQNAPCKTSRPLLCSCKEKNNYQHAQNYQQV